MLKGISPILSPDLLHILASMGHGDEIVIADGNFPSANYGQRLARLDGHGVPEVLQACLDLIPVDQYTVQPIVLMEVVKGDPVVPTIWDDYKKIISETDELFTDKGKKINDSIEMMERFAFYERAKKAFAVVATGETAIYANIIIKKGVV
ncbi:MAG: RbsD/FucU domain-containing protein [Spirochaetales bacterium]|nr:RbsD/FucU domain-containing protein [Spirochaetales bacterium]